MTVCLFVQQYQIYTSNCISVVKAEWPTLMNQQISLETAFACPSILLNLIYVNAECLLSCKHVERQTKTETQLYTQSVQSHLKISVKFAHPHIRHPSHFNRRVAEWKEGCGGLWLQCGWTPYEHNINLVSLVNAKLLHEV